MKSSYTGPATVFRHEYRGRVFYSVAEVKETQDGKKEYGYKDVQFRRGVDVADHAKINIKQAWESFYVNAKGETVFYVFINDFDLEGGSVKEIQAPREFEQIDEDVPF